MKDRKPQCQGLERRIRELEVLAEIGRTLSTLGVDQILDLVYEQASKIVDLGDALFYIALYDKQKGKVSFGLAVEQGNGQIIDVIRWGKREARFRKVDEDETAGQFRPRTRRDPPGLTEYVIHNKQPVLIAEDFERQAKYLGIQVWPVLGRLERPVCSWLSVPMMVADRVIGVISIQGLEREHAFDQGNLELLASVANQAAVAIENSRLQSELQIQLDKKTRDILASREIDRAIVERIRPGPELQSVLELILEKALERTRASAGHIMWYDEAVGDLVMRAGRGVLESKERARQKIGEGIVGLVAQERKTYRVGDVTEGPWKGIHIPFIADIRSELATPLVDGEALLGVLNVEDPEVDAFDEEDARWLEDLAARAVIAIRGAQAYEALQQEQEQRIEMERFAYLGHAADGIAHRINNTVALLPLCVRDIKQHLGTVDAVVDSNLEMIARNAWYVLELAEVLQKPSRPSEAGRFDINLLIKEAIDIARPPSEIEVITELDMTLPAVQTKKLLIDVFVELITNAVEAMTGCTKKVLEIGSRLAEDKYVEVWFTDTGMGIPEEEQGIIFDLFYTTAEKKEPTAGVAKGFGLWWIKTFLAWQGGEISVDSQVDKVTTFLIKLPVEVQQ